MAEAGVNGADKKVVIIEFLPDGNLDFRMNVAPAMAVSAMFTFIMKLCQPSKPLIQPASFVP